MKLKRIGSAGISHVLLPSLVIVALAIVGTFVLVQGHAESGSTGAVAVVAAAPKSATKKQPKLSAMLQNSKQDGYTLVVTLLDRSNKPVTEALCAGTLDVFAANKDGTPISLTGINGTLPAWDGSACKYRLPVSEALVRANVTAKGDLRLKVDMTYRGSAGLHKSIKSLTLKRIWV